ncbi:hypothetical protein HQ393_05110 [Chitinibacter bivalviorum]|uniref:Uncharacterized protein n=1 Tax=Chitinibacter bivalviorum TaxID=2739434 RepID=A0A7H9BH02_9NEIS|nr:hypothetical protein [Chitinibacter bivalviorum]QLG87682.1 hypothetical protein HQ393_05110 [Chitinibacter bivalviorum]
MSENLQNLKLKKVFRGEEGFYDLDLANEPASIALEIGEKYARRIVACVNVLADCKTEDIEYCIEHKWSPFSGNVFASRVKLQRERDKLLAALKLLTNDTTCAIDGSLSWLALGKTLSLAKDIIAKVAKP